MVLNIQSYINIISLILKKKKKKKKKNPLQFIVLKFKPQTKISVSGFSGAKSCIWAGKCNPVSTDFIYKKIKYRNLQR
jgi:hypothetical protein